MLGPILEGMFEVICVIFVIYALLNLAAFIIGGMVYFAEGRRDPFPTRGSQIFWGYGISIWFMNFCMTPRATFKKKVQDDRLQ